MLSDLCYQNYGFYWYHFKIVGFEPIQLLMLLTLNYSFYCHQLQTLNTSCVIQE